MKKLFKTLVVTALSLGVSFSHAKLSNRQTMKCIDADKLTKSAFLDLQAAYEMRLVTAKDFFQVMDKAPNCPQLRKDLKKLQASAISQFPRSKRSLGRSSSHGKPSSPSGAYEAPPSFESRPTVPDLGNDSDLSFPAPPPMPESDFEEEDDDDFSDFR